MQSLRSGKLLRNPTTWGAGGLVFAIVVSLVLAYVYYHPPGHNKIVAFYTNDALSISPGIDVRMAGIRVGKVEEISMETNQVRVRTRIDNDAFVGDQSQVEVRMLTVVGGYYVTINSIGDDPQGDKPIPTERVTVPYNLMRTLADATKITDNVNAKPINESLNEVQKGLTGTNVEALASIVDAGNSIMSTVDRQRGQVSKILEVSNEYIQALAHHRGELAQLIRKISIALQSLSLYSKGVIALIDGMGKVLSALKPVWDAYENHRTEFVEKVRQYMYKTRLFVERNGVIVRVLQRVQNLFDRVLTAQNARPALLATDLCMPVPGNPC
jgi:phospholipid/cholesterol/gamma-HCH transport system substrate-binding protein